MPNKVLVFNGSPRAQGNTRYLVRQALEAIAERGAAGEEIRLAPLKIAPCNGCDLCLGDKVRHCAIKDDMTGLYDKFLASGAVLFASPVYFFNYTAQLKIFIDRLYGLWNQDHDFMKGKPVGVLLVYGDTDLYSSGGINAVSTFEHMFRFNGADNLGFAYGSANAPGDAMKNAELVANARELARRLAAGGE
jgi:multimeric flavodoxin WrbA